MNHCSCFRQSLDSDCEEGRGSFSLYVGMVYYQSFWPCYKIKTPPPFHTVTTNYVNTQNHHTDSTKNEQKRLTIYSTPSSKWPIVNLITHLTAGEKSDCHFLGHRHNALPCKNLWFGKKAGQPYIGCTFSIQYYGYFSVISLTLKTEGTLYQVQHL